MWDNRITKRNPKAPDWKCRDRSCDGVIWPTNELKLAASARANNVPVGDDFPPYRDEEIPF